MKYISDNMLNRLAKVLTKKGIECDTAIHAIRGDSDSARKMPDAKIFRYLLERRFELRLKSETTDVTLITADKDLTNYCKEFGLVHIYREKPGSKREFTTMADELAVELNEQLS